MCGLDEQQEREREQQRLHPQQLLEEEVEANAFHQNEILYQGNAVAGTEQPAPVTRQREMNHFEKKKHNKTQNKEYERLKKDCVMTQIGKDDLTNIHLLNAGEVSGIDALMTSYWGENTWLKKEAGTFGTQRDVYEQCQLGNYEGFEQLDPLLRNKLASAFVNEKISGQGDSVADGVDYQLYPGDTAAVYVARLKTQGGVRALMHPLFRLGISLGSRPRQWDRPEGDRTLFQEIDEACGSAIMLSTISSQITVQQRQSLRGDYPQGNDGEEAFKKDLKRNSASQIFMAKTLLLAQMSRLTKKDHGTEVDWPYDVSAAFTHCSRVNFVMPGKQADESGTRHNARMWSSYRNVANENQAGIFSRKAATHDMQLRKRDLSRPFVEKKNVAFRGQEGMNVAVGGMGQTGIPGHRGTQRLLKNDGSCGHIYLRMQAGDTDEFGGMLVGFESDAYRKTNQLGHIHGFGNGEYASSFGGQRVDEIGDKYGGRMADLSEFQPADIEGILSVLESYMLSYQSKLSEYTEQGLSEEAFLARHQSAISMEEALKPLVGKKMNAQELTTYLSTVILTQSRLMSTHGTTTVQ